MGKVLLPDESYAIMGACFTVYKAKGHSFTEHVYQECLEIEFQHLGLPFRSKPSMTHQYRGRNLTHTFEPDFVCFDRIIVELKAVAALTDAHRSQVINYLQAGGFDLGLLVNFGGHPKVQSERLLHSRLIEVTTAKVDLHAASFRSISFVS